MEAQKAICRLCFKIKDGDFKFMDGNVKSSLDTLLLNVNLALSEEPMMCTNCADIVTECFKFKSTCLSTKDHIGAFVDKDNGKLDIKDIYLIKSINESVDDCNVCGCCMGLLRNRSLFLSLDDKKEEVLSVKVMLKKCIPEWDLNIISKPVICAPCQASLQIYFNFMTICSIIEEDLTNYCKTTNMKHKGPIKLNDLPQFTFQGVLASDGGSCKVNVIRKDRDLCEGRESIYECIAERDIKSIKKENQKCGDPLEPEDDPRKPVFVKIEELSEVTEHYNKEFDKNCVNLEDRLAPKGILACREGRSDFDIDIDKIKEELSDEMESKVEPKYFMETEDQTYLPFGNEEVGIKTEQHDFDSFQDGNLLPKSADSTKLRKVLKNPEPSPGSKHSKYQSGTFCKTSVKVRKLTPSKKYIYQCAFCSHQARYKSHLRIHMLNHKDPTQGQMFRCESCPYETSRKCDLRKHTLLHKDPSEVQMYQCETCSHQTRYKDGLRKHMLIHKDPTQAQMYQCESCPFQTIYKSSLTQHMIVHGDPSELQMYHCESCLYKTRHKRCLQSHILKHKSPLELKMYKCVSCPYETRHKDNLRKHMIIHKDPSEIQIYQCTFCMYETKFKNHLKRHMITHQIPSESTVYQCATCPYQSRRKDDLKTHMITHKSPSELTMYQCPSCPFQTKYKNGLKRHVLSHSVAFRSN